MRVLGAGAAGRDGKRGVPQACGTGPPSFVREEWKGQEEVLRILVRSQTCPPTPIPSALLYLEEETRARVALTDQSRHFRPQKPEVTPALRICLVHPQAHKVRGGSRAGDHPWCHRHCILCLTGKTNDTGLLGERGDHPPSNFTPDFLTSLQKNKTLNETLLSKCHEDERCIYDSLATGNTDTGLNTRMLFASQQRMNATLSKWREARGRRLQS